MTSPTDSLWTWPPWGIMVAQEEVGKTEESLTGRTCKKDIVQMPLSGPVARITREFTLSAHSHPLVSPLPHACR